MGRLPGLQTGIGQFKVNRFGKGSLMSLRKPTSLHKKSRASTAELTAAVRAIHQRYPVRLFEDPFARFLCGWFWRLVVRVPLLSWIVVHGLLRAIEPVSLCVLLRGRYAEQALEAAVEKGIDQYVIIGAGMDSFAFRRPDLMSRIDVFEIDHPLTQSQKLARIRQAGWTIPPRLHFVSADLTRVSAVEALEGSGFQRSRPTFLTLMGVAYYLSAEDLGETAESIARNLPEGTLLLLDYLLDETSSSSEHRVMKKKLKAFVAKRGEPMKAEYSMASMNALMAARGFDAVESLTLPELELRYRSPQGAWHLEIPSIFAVGTFRVAAR
ncbi:MAG: class I SAM-dependent methyltransferase [Acidobacteria bacterium]|nr:class I SAM-dependent methyltransferase [Acidobacteriota bacterium]